MINLTVILINGECRSLVTNLEGLELFLLIQKFKKNEIIREVR